MKTGIEFREGISGTGGTSIRLSSKMSMKKKIIVRISNHKKIQSLEELGSMIIHRVKRIKVHLSFVKNRRKDPSFKICEEEKPYLQGCS